MALIHEIRGALEVQSLLQLLFLIVCSLISNDDANLGWLLTIMGEVVLADIFGLLVINYDFYQEPRNFNGFGLMVHLISLVAGTFGFMFLYCESADPDFPQYCSSPVFVKYGNVSTLTALTAVMGAIKCSVVI